MSIVIKHKKYKLEIKQDLEPEDPRNFDGNITRIICFHNRYELIPASPGTFNFSA